MWIAGMLILAACTRPVTGTSATAAVAGADEAAIRTAGAARDTSFTALDANGFAAAFADDGVLMVETAKSVRTRAMIGKFMDIYMRLMTEGGYTPVFNDIEIKVSGDLAFRSGSYTVTDKAGAMQDKGKWLEAWRKADGAWHIDRAIWNSDMLPLFAPMAFAEQGWVAPN